MSSESNHPARTRATAHAWFAALALASVVLGSGCKPQVGDSCKLSTDCSITGDRLCDTSQPDGYCTIFNCEPDTCPGDSTCVEFHSSSLRFSRRFCLATCGSPSDCRPGYVCIPPKDRDAKILDNSPAHSTICLP
ncbi:MAG: hypothetical protein NVSMB47_13450 [Polyangiales bacterium]